MARSESGASGEAQHRPPAGWWRWQLDGQPIGWLAPAHQRVLAAWGIGAEAPGAPTEPRCWHCLSEAGPAGDAGRRSAWLEALAIRLREAGLVKGWRGERYRCQLSRGGEEPATVPGQGRIFFELERAAYRFFGLTSQAVHVNGVTPAGELWCGRRALHKATDPGRLDNLAAGGLPAGEDPLSCARRELWEEAGVPMALSQPLQHRGLIRTSRVEPEGWHDEWLHVFELALPADFVPVNQDGEVSAFESLPAVEVASRIESGDFSPDAAAVSALWWQAAVGAAAIDYSPPPEQDA